jgi:transcriptional regulator with XRE-family HTH domain
LKKTERAFLNAVSKVPKDVKELVRLKFDIADRVYELIKQKGLNQKEFAKNIGMKESQLSAIISGKNITLRTIAKLQAELNEEIIRIPKWQEDFTVSFDLLFDFMKVRYQSIDPSAMLFSNIGNVRIFNKRFIVSPDNKTIEFKGVAHAPAEC